jgi:hypothetical protein
MSRRRGSFHDAEDRAIEAVATDPPPPLVNVRADVAGVSMLQLEGGDLPDVRHGVSMLQLELVHGSAI